MLKPNGKYEKRITAKDYNKAREFIMNLDGIIDMTKLATNAELQNRVRIVLENSGKTKIPLDKFRENLDRNMHLVLLHENFIPKEIQDNFYSHIDEIDMTKQVFSFDRISMLQGTEYAKEATIRIISDAY